MTGFRVGRPFLGTHSRLQQCKGLANKAPNNLALYEKKTTNITDYTVLVQSNLGILSLVWPCTLNPYHVE